jgi:hypothetical protein
VLKLVDSFTEATCHPGSKDAVGLKGPLVTEPFSCALQAEKERCEAGGGMCEILRDGYYTVNILCVLFGMATCVVHPAQGDAPAGPPAEGMEIGGIEMIRVKRGCWFMS